MSAALALLALAAVLLAALVLTELARPPCGLISIPCPPPVPWLGGDAPEDYDG